MNPQKIPAFDSESGARNVIVDTPKGSRNKFSWDQEWKLFEMLAFYRRGPLFSTI
jgi:inorganic pyrophosphatase